VPWTGTRHEDCRGPLAPLQSNLRIFLRNANCSRLGAVLLQTCFSNVQHTRGASVTERRGDVMRWAHFDLAGLAKNCVTLARVLRLRGTHSALAALHLLRVMRPPWVDFSIFCVPSIRMHSSVTQGSRRINECQQRCYSERPFLILSVAARLRNPWPSPAKEEMSQFRTRKLS
jgi:hypothetical protein